MSTFKLIFAELLRDRAVQLGTSTSSLSIYGAAQVRSAPPDWVGHVTAYVGLYAAIIGGLSATATFIYVVIKIRRLLKTPAAVE